MADKSYVVAERMTPLEETDFLLKAVAVRAGSLVCLDDTDLAAAFALSHRAYEEIDRAALEMIEVIGRAKYRGASDQDILAIKDRFNRTTDSFYAQINYHIRTIYDRAVFGN
ncbi:MAG: hypothetical protein ACP5N7_04010 [Candidatus Pacearchaeota archaeon]